MTDIRALTLWRPWPALIVHHGKDAENRTWTTRWRGLLVLHGGRRLDKQVIRQFRGAGRDLEAEGFLGVAELTDVHHADTCGNRCSDWATPDAYHWILADPRPFPAPISGPGGRGLLHPPQPVIDAVHAVLAQASPTRGAAR